MISIASSIGTPAAISAEKVREKRASATFWTMSPILNGNLQLEAVPLLAAALADFFQRRKVQTTADDDRRCSRYHLPRDEVRERTVTWVIAGSLPPKSLKTLLEHRHEERDERDQHDPREARR